MDVLVRPATPEDPAAELLYESARPYYDAYAGDPGHARALVAELYPVPDHAASFDITRVAVLDGAVAGVLAGFSTAEGDRLARRFVSLSFRRLPLRRWPVVLRHLRAAGAVAPHPPPGTWYVDALATHPDYRRRGVARALLDEADRIARRAGLDGVSLDTGLANTPARALYESTGFLERERRHAPSARIERAIGGPGFVSYLKPST